MQKGSIMKKISARSRENTKLQKAAITAAVSVGASVAATSIGVACLAAFYSKTLKQISYIAEQDIYEE